MADVKIIEVQEPGKNTGIWHLAAGILMMLLGIYVWFNPEVTLMALALYLGVVLIVAGAAYFMASFSFKSGWYMLVGLLDMFVGIIFVTNLGVTAVSLPVILAIWCLAVGIIQTVAAFGYKQRNIPWYWSLFAGMLGIVFAFLILAYPYLGAIAITTLAGMYFILYGIVQVIEYKYHRDISFS